MKYVFSEEEKLNQKNYLKSHYLCDVFKAQKEILKVRQWEVEEEIRNIKSSLQSYESESRELTKKQELLDEEILAMEELNPYKYDQD